jgi:hypothetical protein
VPGAEAIYSFTPAITGNYTFDARITAGAAINFYLTNICSNTGTNLFVNCWGGGTKNVTLSAGTTYYFIIDNGSIHVPASYTFFVTCPASQPPFEGGRTCLDGNPFCTSNQYTFPALTDNPSMGTIGCLGTTPNAVWYWMRIDNPGTVIINIAQSGGADVDFICWGPFGSINEACADKTMTGGSSNHGHTEPYPVGNIVDCCYCSLAIETCVIPNAQQGQVYLLLMTNYANRLANLNFELQPGSTGTTNCGIITPPVSSNSPICKGDTLQLTSNDAPNCTFAWTGPNGFTSNQQNPVIPNATPVNSGIYSLTVSYNGQQGLPQTTSVVVNAPSDTTRINDTICSNLLPYTLYGFNRTTAGRDTLRLQNAVQCDSVVLLNLTVNQPSDTTFISVVTCTNQLPYTQNGFNLSTAGRHIRNLSNAERCDSIVVLDLEINAPDTTYINSAICKNNLPYMENGFNVSTAGRHIRNLQNIHNCDSVVRLTLAVDTCLHIDSIAEICGDDESFYVHFQNTGGDLDCVYINFSQQAKSTGFSDVSCLPLNGDSIEIQIPQNVRPNDYSVEFVFEYANGNQVTENVGFRVLYPASIIQQKWNNVLALLNSDYNGGYDFTHYQWYINDAPIAGANSSYIYLGENKTFNLSSEYRVKLIRALDKVTLLTCPFIPSQRTEINVLPTYGNANSIVVFKARAKASGKVTFMSVSGIKVSEQNFSEGENYIKTPPVAGLYITIVEENSIEPKKQIMVVK